VSQRRVSDYHRSSLNGLTMRAGRAAEDPHAMTVDATLGRLAKHMAAVHTENPDLTPDELARAARLRLRAEMGQLARKSAAARQARAAGGTEAQPA
jgi:hypothetical protein